MEMAIFVLAPQLCVDILVQQVKEACFVAAAEIPLMILQSILRLFVILNLAAMSFGPSLCNICCSSYRLDPFCDFFGNIQACTRCIRKAYVPACLSLLGWRWCSLRSRHCIVL